VQTLSMWRVYRTKCECVWAGPIRCSTPEIGYGELLETLFEKHIAVPKQFAGKIAGHLMTHCEDGAKMLEAYPASYHHAAVQEFGLGLALNAPHKWAVEWPQYEWEVLETASFFGSHWTTEKYQWTVPQLAQQRKKRGRRVRGMDPMVWDMLGDLRK
jgi:hypothetical protein